ncbi:MAG TPA: hypothetical protein VII06_14480 [Chloroflexota bacterium]|jgi:hypothetical protein
MYRQHYWHPALVALLALALLTTLGGLSPAPVGYAAPPAAPALAPPAAVDGPGHHFGFTQARVLAQSTSQQTLIPTGGSGQVVTTGQPCTTTINTTCTGTLTGGGSITYLKNGSGVVTITVTDPVGSVAGSGKVIFAGTTAGVITVIPGTTAGATCTPATVTAGTVETCSLLIPAGDLLAGNSVVVSFLTAGGIVNFVGTVSAAPGTGTGSSVIQKYVSAVNGIPSGYGYGTGSAVSVHSGDRVTFQVVVNSGSGTVTVRDFLGPNYTFVNSAASGCTPASAPASLPAGVAPNATVVDCTATVSGYPYGGYPLTGGYPGSAAVTIDATVNAAAPQSTDANANVACMQPSSSFTGPYGGADAPCAVAPLTIASGGGAAGPSLRNIIGTVNGSAPTPSNTNANVPPGAAVAFQVTATMPVSTSPYGTYPYGYPPAPTVPTTITDFVSPNFTVNLSEVSGASCLIVATPANRPAGVAADATTIECTPTVDTAGTAAVALVAHLKANAPAGADSQANVACLGGSAGYVSPYGSSSFSSCMTVQAQISGAGGVASGSPTLQQAMSQTPPSGQPGTACAIGPTGACAVAGAVSGQGVVSGSMRWTLTATVPAGVAAGTLPFAVFSTTTGQEGFACAPVTVGAATVSCTGVTAGNALQGSVVTVVFGAGLTATGTVAPTGGALGAAGALPLLPPAPPAPFPAAPLPPPGLPLPPPPVAPPALMPPPPFATGAAPAMPTGAAAAPTARYAEVPVVPEADSLLLVAVGLAGLTALGWLRRRRGPAA